MTEAQSRALSRIASRAEWCWTPIDRSGCSKEGSAARQWLAKRGLIEGHPTMRRVWRITEAGRRAIQGEGR